MKIILLICLALAVSAMHILAGFQHQIAALKEHYAAGDTSRVYSIFMKLLVQTQKLYEERNIAENVQRQFTSSNCTFILHELVGLSSHPNWNQIYQEIYPRILHLHKTCTNSDFSYGTSPDLKDFQNKCALCSVITTVMQNYIIYHRRDVTNFVENEFCSMFDGLVKPTCQAFTHYIGPHIIKGLLNKENADQICHGSGLCKNPKCRIKSTFEPLDTNTMIHEQFEKPAPWEWLVHLFTDHFGDKHLPPFDLDNDTFSDLSTFRGYHWRGADCNEFDSKIYPGRKTTNHKLADHDCNGIYGTNLKGHSYEETLCSNSTRYGVVVIGDSAGAHFSIPEKFFNVTMMQKGTFHDLLPRIADQLDIPHESAYTGHSNTSYDSHSIYKYLRKWNLCNNNDYQNLGVNGGDSGNTWGNIKALKRDPSNDYPLMMFLELIGNDVCGSRPDGYTKPEDFKRNIIRLFNWLDETAPKGSHLVIMGLAEGNLLYDILGGATHPLGVTYDKVYDFLNCLQISPCAGWLNTNETIRMRTTQHAMMLSKIYQQILDQGFKPKNYDILYFDFPTEQMMKRKQLQGGDTKTMIEPCDGFHPSIEFNTFLADWMWYKIQQLKPEWLGQPNPHNEEIKRIFGLHDLN